MFPLSFLPPFACWINCHLLACLVIVSMFVNLSWCFRRLIIMYLSCPIHVSTRHTHKQSLEHCRTSVVTVVLRSISSVTLVISCCDGVTHRVMFCLLFQWSVVVMLSMYGKCVITISSSSQVTFLPHLAIYPKNPFERPTHFDRAPTELCTA